jgi:hypothetical protein
MALKNRISGDLSVVVNTSIRSNKISWAAVANLVNRHSNKPYARYYIRDVALGYRTNNKIKEILDHLNISKEFHKEAI